MCNCARPVFACFHVRTCMTYSIVLVFSFSLPPSLHLSFGRSFCALPCCWKKKKKRVNKRFSFSIFCLLCNVYVCVCVRVRAKISSMCTCVRACALYTICDDSSKLCSALNWNEVLVSFFVFLFHLILFIYFIIFAFSFFQSEFLYTRCSRRTADCLFNPNKTVAAPLCCYVTVYHTLFLRTSYF